jgi:hypothetical protein
MKLVEAEVPVIIRSVKFAPPKDVVTVCLPSSAAAGIPEEAISAGRSYAVTLNGSESEEILRKLSEQTFLKFFLYGPGNFSGRTYVYAGRRIGQLLNSRQANREEANR